MKTKQKMLRGGAHGGWFQDFEICEIKFTQARYERRKNYMKKYLKPKTKSRTRDQLNPIDQIAETSMRYPDTSRFFFRLFKMRTHLFYLKIYLIMG